MMSFQSMTVSQRVSLNGVVLLMIMLPISAGSNNKTIYEFLITGFGETCKDNVRQFLQGVNQDVYQLELHFHPPSYNRKLSSTRPTQVKYNNNWLLSYEYNISINHTD